MLCALFFTFAGCVFIMILFAVVVLFLFSFDFQFLDVHFIFLHFLLEFETVAFDASDSNFICSILLCYFFLVRIGFVFDLIPFG